MSRVLCLLLLVAAGCSLAPRESFEAGAPPPDAHGDQGGDAAGTPVALLMDRPFGQEGERPVALAMGKSGSYLVVSDVAVYSLDDQARQLSRAPHPTGSGGARALIQAAHWDGAGLGMTLRWPGDNTTAAAWTLALTNSADTFSGGSMVKVADAGGRALGALVGGNTHATLTAMSAQYTLRRQERGKAATTVTLTRSSSFPLVSAGDLAALPGVSSGGLGLCARGEAGRLDLHLIGSDNMLTPLAVHVGGARPAVGGCRLAGSGRSALVTYNIQGLPYAQLDLGTGAPDIGVKGVSYPVPMMRVFPSGGGAASEALRLSHKSIAEVQDLLWDGTRYLLLMLASGRGGRLLLTVLDEAGALQARDMEIPLSYEPGLLLGARLAADASGYTLLYASRRPWDEGVLHLARFTITW